MNNCEPVIMTPQAACFVLTVKGTLSKSLTASISISLTHSQWRVDDSVVEVNRDLLFNERRGGQSSPLLRVVAMIVSDNDTTQTCIFNMFQNIRTQALDRRSACVDVIA